MEESAFEAHGEEESVLKGELGTAFGIWVWGLDMEPVGGVGSTGLRRWVGEKEAAVGGGW